MRCPGRYIGSSYQRDNFDNLSFDRHVVGVEVAIRELELEYSNVSVAVSGMSGILVGHALVMRHGRAVTVVRKPQDTAHGFAIEGFHPHKFYVIVDDMCSSGATVDYIRRTFEEHFDYRHCRLLCAIMYKTWGVTHHPTVPTFHCNVGEGRVSHQKVKAFLGEGNTNED